MVVRAARVAILVKALPQPSKRYGETVCCAGITIGRELKRLFPIRFRHLEGSHSFSRWDWVDFRFDLPTHDRRPESCHVHEESIVVGGKVPTKERSHLLNPVVVGSAKEAAAKGKSLALIRPAKSRFIYKEKDKAEISEERDAYRNAARQGSLFDKRLAEMEPSPFMFRFRFEDQSGRHDYECGDWEVNAMFWREAKRTSADRALLWMDQTFNEEYPKRGMIFAIGNQAKRPQTWQLLGVIRLDEAQQEELLI